MYHSNMIQIIEEMWILSISLTYTVFIDLDHVWQCLSELSVENGIATLCKRALQLNVKDIKDVTTLLKHCHWTEIATKSTYHKTRTDEKACKLQLKQTLTNPVYISLMRPWSAVNTVHCEPEHLIESCHQRRVCGIFLCVA